MLPKTRAYAYEFAGRGLAVDLDGRLVKADLLPQQSWATFCMHCSPCVGAKATAFKAVLWTCSASVSR